MFIKFLSSRPILEQSTVNQNFEKVVKNFQKENQGKNLKKMKRNQNKEKMDKSSYR